MGLGHTRRHVSVRNSGATDKKKVCVSWGSPGRVVAQPLLARAPRSLFRGVLDGDIMLAPSPPNGWLRGARCGDGVLRAGTSDHSNMRMPDQEVDQT